MRINNQSLTVIGAVFLACLGIWQLAQGAYIPTKAWLAQVLMQRAWTHAREGEQRPTPWPWADTWPVAKLTFENDDADLIVLAGGSGSTLAFGPGHLSESALPGSPGNTVIAGHRDTHFSVLQSVEIGASLIVETPHGARHHYTVTTAEVVDARHGRLLLDSEESLLSLVTCYPFDATEPGGPLRYVVTARMTPDDASKSASRLQP